MCLRYTICLWHIIVNTLLKGDDDHNDNNNNNNGHDDYILYRIRKCFTMYTPNCRVQIVALFDCTVYGIRTAKLTKMKE